MPQEYLPFKYQEETTLKRMTTFAGLLPCIELDCVAGLAGSIEKNLRIRDDSQGWTDTEQILALTMLNIAEGKLH